MVELPVPCTDEAACRALYPWFQTRQDLPNKKGGTLASHNIRRLLRATWPACTFSVKIDSCSAGVSVMVGWQEWPEGPGIDSRALGKALRVFEYGRFDPSTDYFESDDDPARRMFRSLFGSLRHVSIQSSTATPEMVAQRDRLILERTLVVPAPASSVRRQRL